MRVMAFEKISVCTENGKPDPKSYIASGDLCTVSDKTLAGLYPVTYPTARGEKTRWVKDLSGFLCNQNDYGHLAYAAPGYPNATVKSGSCGVCAAVNALGALLGKQISVREMRDLAKTCGARVSGGTDMKVLTAALSRRYGISCTLSNSREELEAHLKAGGTAVCNAAGRGMFSTGGHFVTALGMLEGKACIADPGLYRGKYDTFRRKQAVAQTGDLLLTSLETVDADCTGRWPRYYLLGKRA